MSKECELCFDSIARIYCESDEARLCWKCDEKVHCANFLVSRHLRNLLCHVCHTKTPWQASGSKLIDGRPSVFVCENCVVGRRGKGGNEDYNDIFSVGNVDQGEMVVPKSSSTSLPRPPSVVLSSSDESVKDVADLHSHQDDYLCCSSSEANYLGTAKLAAAPTGWKPVSFNHDNVTYRGPFDHSKKRKKDQTMTSGTQTKSRKTLKLMGAVIELQQDVKKKHCFGDNIDHVFEK